MACVGDARDERDSERGVREERRELNVNGLLFVLCCLYLLK